MKEPRRLKVGLLGAGNMGLHHLKALKRHPGFELVHVYEPNPSDEVRTLAGESLITQMDAFKPAEIEAAIIAAPTETHAELSRWLLKAGVAVLVEKPAATDLDEASALVDLARRYGVAFAVGHIERCNPVVDAAQSLLNHHVLGPLVNVSAIRSGGYPRSVRPGNQVFLDLAVHELDVLSRLFQKVQVVGGYCHHIRTEGIPDLAQIQLDLNDVTPALIHVDWLTPQKKRQLIIRGTEGVAEIDYMNQSATVYMQQPISKNLPFRVTAMDHPHCSAFQIDITRAQPIDRQLQEFYNLACGQASILCRDFEILESLKLLDDCVDKCGAVLTPKRMMHSSSARYLN